MGKLLYILLLLPLSVCAQSIHISTPSGTACHGFALTFAATDTGTISPYYQWTINGGTVAGADSSLFISDTLSNGDTVACLLTNSAHDSIIAHSNSVIVTIQVPASAGIITGTDSIVCVGATITLNDTVPGGVWRAGNNYVTISGGVVTGVHGEEGEDGQIPSEDSIFYTVNNACGRDTAFKIITIEPKPEAFFNLGTWPYGTNILCVGEGLSIFSGDEDFCSEGTMYSASGNVLVDDCGATGISPGTDYLYCVATNICGSDTFGRTITVYAATTISSIRASATHVCVGSTTALADSTTGVPHWYSGNYNASVGYANGVVTGELPGLDTIILVAMNSCSSASDSITITIDPPQPIIGIDSFCAGRQSQFFDSTKGGIWSSSNTFVATIDDGGTINGLLWGYTVISYTLPSSGCTTTWETEVWPDFVPTPITGETEFCLSSVTLLSEVTDGGIWSSSNTDVASVNVSGEVSGISVGVATITYSFKGCIETKDVSVAVCEDEMNIYPNPSHDVVTIYAFDNIYTTYSFINAIGQVAIRGTLAGPFTQVDVGLLPPGLYAIIVLGAQDRYVSKFVKD